MKMRIQLLILLFIIGDKAVGQNRKLDSLYNALTNHRYEDTTRVRILLRICHIEYTSYPEKCMMHTQEALKISRSLNYEKGQGEAIRYIALYHWSSGEYEQAIEYAYETLRIFERISYTKGLGLVYQLLGTIDREQGNFEESSSSST
jgi:tetratricopeptide (TPR) repeat protein